jgi:hypothetical protein
MWTVPGLPLARSWLIPTQRPYIPGSCEGKLRTTGPMRSETHIVTAARRSAGFVWVAKVSPVSLINLPARSDKESHHADRVTS